MSSCPAKPVKEKKFGVAVCRERKCIDLQKDPKYPDSPQHCAVTHGMPGSMHCCVKEMDADHFIRHISGQLNNGPYTSRPGPRNCPKECPYKILVDGEKFVFVKGKPESSKVPAKIGTCAFTGKPLGDWGVCPCNVLGKEPKFQESQILQIKAAIDRCQDVSRDAFESGHACGGTSCPDGIQRIEHKGTTCPLIRVPFKDLKECPLWRIPAKMLPAPDASDSKSVPDIKKNPPARNCSLKECLEKKCEDVVDKPYPGPHCGNPIRICQTLGKTPQNIHRSDCPNHLYDDQSGSDTKVTEAPLRDVEKPAQKDKPTSKKPVQKEQPDATDTKIAGSRQLTFMDFVISRKSGRSTVQDPRCKRCESSPDCLTHDPEKENCVAKALRKKSARPPSAGTGGGPQPIQHCCGTCGHHKGRKTFHETCPRLGELLFKGGPKSAKVLMEETAGSHPCAFWITKEADRFGPCPEKNSMGSCMHGAYSCPHKTEQARSAVGCTYPIQPPHFAGDSPIMKKGASKKPNCGGKRPAIMRCPDDCPEKMIVPEDHGKEKNYPQGRCRITGEKLREMKACPNDPPKRSVKKS